MPKVNKAVRSAGRFLFVILIAIGAFVFAMFQGGVVSWTIFYAIIPFILYSILLTFYPLIDFRAERKIRTPNVQNGEKLSVQLLLNRRFRFPLLYTVIEEKWHDETILKETGKLKKLYVLGFKKELEWEYEVERMPRGEHLLEGVNIEVTDFFGWIRKSYLIPIKSTVLVYPKTMNIQYVPIDTQYEQGSMISPYSIVQDTTMASGVRDYQSGDRVSWIHWKSFARTQLLMTKEFEDRQSQDLFLVLDKRPSEAFEEQVEFAASIVQEALKQQAGIGFLSLGAESGVFPSVQSEGQLRDVFIHLAKITPEVNYSPDRFIDFRSELVQGGSVIIITGNPNWSFLESMIAQVTSPQSMICFVVVPKKEAIHGKLAEDIKIAKSKGIRIQTLVREQFSSAFREVSRS